MKKNQFKRVPHQVRIDKAKKRKKKKAKSWLGLPLTKLGDRDKEMNSFLIQEARKMKAEQIEIQRKIDLELNLNDAVRMRLIDKMVKTKRTLIRFVASVDRLRRLIEKVG